LNGPTRARVDPLASGGLGSRWAHFEPGAGAPCGLDSNQHGCVVIGPKRPADVILDRSHASCVPCEDPRAATSLAGVQSRRRSRWCR
jgi:hypothetical protein